MARRSPHRAAHQRSASGSAAASFVRASCAGLLTPGGSARGALTARTLGCAGGRFVSAGTTRERAHACGTLR
jgi:hypothetical protein